jgi:hypothetical protein
MACENTYQNLQGIGTSYSMNSVADGVLDGYKATAAVQKPQIAIRSIPPHPSLSGAYAGVASPASRRQSREVRGALHSCGRRRGNDSGAWGEERKQGKVSGRCGPFEVLAARTTRNRLIRSREQQPLNVGQPSWSERTNETHRGSANTRTIWPLVRMIGRHRE